MFMKREFWPPSNIYVEGHLKRGAETFHFGFCIRRCGVPCSVRCDEYKNLGRKKCTKRGGGGGGCYFYETLSSCWPKSSLFYLGGSGVWWERGEFLGVR